MFHHHQSPPSYGVLATSAPGGEGQKGPPRPEHLKIHWRGHEQNFYSLMADAYNDIHTDVVLTTQDMVTQVHCHKVLTETIVQAFFSTIVRHGQQLELSEY